MNCVQLLPRNSDSGSGEARGEQEREQDRQDAEQPADGALREPQHEEADEVQDDQQVDRPDPAEDFPEIHVRLRADRSRQSRSRARLAAAVRTPQGTRQYHLASADAAERCGPEASRQVRKRAPRSSVRPLTTRGDRLVDLGVGQRPLVVAERQPVGQALVGLGERLAAVDVEQRDVAQQRAAVAPDGRLDRRAAGGLDRDDDRQVALDRCEPGRGRHAIVGEAAAGEAGDRDLRDVDPLGTQVERRDRLGMQLADPTDEIGRRPGLARRGRGGGSDRR